MVGIKSRWGVLKGAQKEKGKSFFELSIIFKNLKEFLSLNNFKNFWKRSKKAQRAQKILKRFFKRIWRYF